MKKVWAWVFLAPFLLLGFQNCGQGFKAPEGFSSSSAFCKSDLSMEASPFMGKKVQLPEVAFQKAQSKLSTSPQSLGLLVDTQCLKTQPTDFLGQAIELNGLQQSLPQAVAAIELPTLSSVATLEQEMEKSPCFIGLAQNLKVEKGQVSQGVNDPQATVQRHLNFLGYYESRSLQQQINQQVVVAVIDSGVDYNHVDLSQRMWEDANGNHGANLVTGTLNPLDDDGHGTHVAGIIAAKENNSFGTAGLNGDFVRIMAIKALDSQGAGSSQDVHDGIQYAVQQGADIINLSIQSQGENPLLASAISQAVSAGVVVITATGNNSSLMTNSFVVAPAYLAPQINGLISVASVDSATSQLSFFSNYSPTVAEIAAPGAENGSDFNNGGILSLAPNDRWVRTLGTSQSVPMVSAAAAMLIGYLRTQGATYNPAGIESFLRSDGAGVSTSLSSYVSGGRVVQMGWLAQNLEYYFNGTTPPSTLFNGNQTTGNTCIRR